MLVYVFCSNNNVLLSTKTMAIKKLIQNLFFSPPLTSLNSDSSLRVYLSLRFFDFLRTGNMCGTSKVQERSKHNTIRNGISTRRGNFNGAFFCYFLYFSYGVFTAASTDARSTEHYVFLLTFVASFAGNNGYNEI